MRIDSRVDEKGIEMQTKPAAEEHSVHRQDKKLVNSSLSLLPSSSMAILHPPRPDMYTKDMDVCRKTTT